MPAKAGIQLLSKSLDASLHWHDKDISGKVTPSKKISGEIHAYLCYCRHVRKSSDWKR